MKKSLSSLWRRPSVGVLLVSLVLLSVASIVAVRSAVVEAGHEISAPNAVWPFLALLAVTSVVAVLVVLAAIRMPGINARGAMATGIRWGAAIAAGLRPLVMAALYPWLGDVVVQGQMPVLRSLLEVGWQIGRPADTIVYILTGNSLHQTDLLPRGFVELWLLTGLVSVALWSVVGALLLLGARRVSSRDARRTVPPTS